MTVVVQKQVQQEDHVITDLMYRFWTVGTQEINGYFKYVYKRALRAK